MPRIRTIKPTFFRSRSVKALTDRQKLVWVGLWPLADDEGRLVDEPGLLVGDLWALSMTEAQFDKILTELHTAGRIIRYQTGGERFIQVTNWFEHQRIAKPSPSLFPPPPAPDDSGSPTGIVPEPYGLERKGKETGRGKEEERNARSAGTVTDDRFDEFWTIYPRPVDKPAAARAWTKAIRRTDPDVILAGARRYADDPNRIDQYTKHPGPWLNAEAWNNPPLPARNTGARESSLDRVTRQREQTFADLARIEQLPIPRGAIGA